MADHQPQLDVLIIGATGYTSRLTARYLGHHPQKSSFKLGLAARSKEKLSALVKDIGLSDADVTLLTVDVTKPEQVEEVVKKTRVVINGVGPYAIWGTPVVAACVRNGVHYVDLTGETPWIKEIVNRFHYAASKTRAIVVPSCGFDSIPSDTSAYLGAKTLQTFCSAEPDYPGVESSLSSIKIKAGVSGGTVASAFNLFSMFPQRELIRATQDNYLSPYHGAQSTNKLWYNLVEPDTGVRHAGATFFMKTTNRAIVQRTMGLLQISSTESTGRPRLSKIFYGPRFKYDEFMYTGNHIISTVVNFSLLSLLALVIIPPIRRILQKIMPQSGAGPSEEQLRNGRMKVVNITKSAHSSPIQVKTTITGKGDPGYFLTAQMLGESALALALQHSDLPPLAQEGGVLTPMTALGDVLINRLTKSKTFTIESVVLGREGEIRKSV